MEYTAYLIHKVSNRNGFVKNSPLKKRNFFATDNAPLLHSFASLINWLTLILIISKYIFWIKYKERLTVVEIPVWSSSHYSRKTICWPVTKGSIRTSVVDSWAF